MSGLWIVSCIWIWGKGLVRRGRVRASACATWGRVVVLVGCHVGQFECLMRWIESAGRVDLSMFSSKQGYLTRKRSSYEVARLGLVRRNEWLNKGLLTQWGG